MSRQFIPLAINSLYFYNENQSDGSNNFIYSRFLTPYLWDFKGFAVYADGDMICNADISELADLFDTSKAVQLVKHDYKTKRFCASASPPINKSRTIFSIRVSIVR